MTNAVIMWVIFGVVIFAMLIIDLAVFHKKAHQVKLKEAVAWSIVWIALALLFNLGVYYELGHDLGLKFLTGYLIEKSLSMDNLFVFLVIFTYFGVPFEYQHKVLFWGILGALFFRAIFIAAGVTLVQSLQWTIYILGAFLVFTGIKLAFEKDKEIHPERNPVIRIFKRFMPVTNDFVQDRFIIQRAGKYFATPLLIALIVVETTDVVFATDSIPAILGITTDPFIVYTSNIFAILGLRALYFVLARIMQIFRYLHYGLSIILIFVGIKMLFVDLIHIPVNIALSFVGGILTISILFSILFPSKESTIQSLNKIEPKDS